MAEQTKAFTKLRRLNIVAGCLHTLQAIAVLLLSTNFKLPVTASFLEFNDATQKLDPASTTLFNVPFAPLIAGFFMLSALAHFFIAGPFYRWYVANLKRHINKARWYEYSVSASIMIILISMLVGVYDFASLLMLFALTAIMNLCGLLMELWNQKTEKVNWASYWVGCLAGIIPWLVIALYFYFSAANGSAAPTFVYWIFVSLFLFFNCFALNMYLQYKKIGPWKNYLFGEKAYVWLSLTAKSALAWQIFFGTLRP